MQSNRAMLKIRISIIVPVNMQRRQSNNCKGQGILVNIILLFQRVNTVPFPVDLLRQIINSWSLTADRLLEQGEDG